MNYELAKKLKDAGFPQETKAGGEVFNDKEKGDGTIENGSFIKKPTLSELIEACGDKFGKLEKGEFAFEASSKDEQFGDYGGTPEEAVANLWLELNKN